MWVSMPTRCMKALNETALVTGACMLQGHTACTKLLLAFTKGARQLVVQEALEMIWSLCL